MRIWSFAVTLFSLLNVVVDMWIHSDAVCEWLGCWEQKREAKEEYIVKVPGTFEHVSSPDTRAECTPDAAIRCTRSRYTQLQYTEAFTLLH